MLFVDTGTEFALAKESGDCHEQFVDGARRFVFRKNQVLGNAEGLAQSRFSDSIDGIFRRVDGGHEQAWL